MSNSDFIRIGSVEEQLFIRRQDISRIVVDIDDVIIYHINGDGDEMTTKMSAVSVDLDNLLSALNNDTPPTPPANAVRLVGITHIIRGETKNTGSPIWRCYTDTGEQVNIFKHDDPTKDSYHIIAPFTGFATRLDAMQPEERLDTYPNTTQFIIRANGPWNELIAVRPTRALLELNNKNASRTPHEILNSAMSNLDTLERIRNAQPLEEVEPLEKWEVPDDDQPPSINYDNIPPGSLAPDAS